MRMIITVLFAAIYFAGSVPAQQHSFDYKAAIQLPDVIIDGKVARIHSQGLYVTDRHFLVTGRLEEKPKRAILLRFSRSEPDLIENAEYIDMTRPNIDGQTLDHPGGFDLDDSGLFQIPLSTSHPRGPSLVLGFRVDPDQPLAAANIESTIRVDDHVGAICCVGPTMLGANWDTLVVHTIQNHAVTASPRQFEVFGRGNSMVAVQDWKSIKDSNGASTHRIILGGLVKSEQPRAVIRIIELRFSETLNAGTAGLTGDVMESHRFEMRDDVSRPITNEGMAVHDGALYLLPEDIGRGAKILLYSMTANKAKSE